MLKLQILAALLLIMRIVTVWYLGGVINIQNRLLSSRIVDGTAEITDPKVISFRKYLHYMTIALLVGNVPAIILDTAVMVGVTRTTPYLIIYAIANAITTLIAVLIIYSMYKLAGESEEVYDFEKSRLRSTDKE